MKTIKFELLVVALIMISVNTFTQTLNHADNYGGKQQLKDFIREEMVYPEKALLDKTEGKVLLSFIVDKEGNIQNLEVKHSVSPELNNEAIRILNLLLWDPAEYRGMALDEQNDIEIEFAIKKYNRIVKSRGYDKIIYPVEPVDSSARIYETIHLDKQPKPIYETKGMNFSSFIMKNMTYPEGAVKQNISGPVTIFFVIEPSGRISNVKVVNSVGAGCNQEAIRLLKLLKWMPGIKNGMAVRTTMTLTITFNLQDFENQKYVPANNSNQI